jgi:hypothetical protein
MYHIATSLGTIFGIWIPTIGKGLPGSEQKSQLACMNDHSTLSQRAPAAAAPEDDDDDDDDNRKQLRNVSGSLRFQRPLIQRNFRPMNLNYCIFQHRGTLKIVLSSEYSLALGYMAERGTRLVQMRPRARSVVWACLMFQVQSSGSKSWRIFRTSSVSTWSKVTTSCTCSHLGRAELFRRTICLLRSPRMCESSLST